MNPEIKDTEYVDVNSPGFQVESEAPLVTVDTPSTNQSTEQLKQVWERIYAFLSSLPDYLGEFFSEYKRPLLTLGLIFASVVSVKLTLALLDAINDIPLLAPTFELIGLAYTAWFIYRYLWKASSREELTQDLEIFKDEILGKGTPKP